MNSFLIYNAKVALALLVFYLFYRFLLKKETFHRLNRVVLVGTAVLSFLLPLCIITIHRPIELQAPAPLPATTETAALPEQVPELLAQTSAPWWPAALTLLFWAGVGLVLSRVAVSILSIGRIIRRGTFIREEDGCRIVVTKRDIDPFSWMHYIVLSRKDWERDHAPILAHEKAHIGLRHSVEVLLVDILSALQWFNPAIWMLRSDLQELHEYEADDAVLRAGTNLKEYQYLLIRKAVSKSGYSVANSFNHSILKNRITMMSKSKSPLSRGLRALYLLPLICLGLGLQARTVYVPVDKDSEKMPASDQILPEVLVLQVREDGIIESGGREVSLKELPELLPSVPAPGTTIQINAHPKTPMRFIGEIKAILREHGALRVRYGLPSEAAAIPRILPPSPNKEGVLTDEEAYARTDRNNIFVVRINAGDKVFFGNGAYDKEADMIRLGKDFLKKRGKDTVFFLGCDRGTSYSAYQRMQALLLQIYTEVREEKSQEVYGKSLTELSEEERDAILKLVPMAVFETALKG